MKKFFNFSRKKAEKRFLQEINAHLPEKVDWKQGAKTYFKHLIQAGGQHNERFHLIKPFVGGPDFIPFFNDLFVFLDILLKLNVPPKSKFLDVGCGPGWITHYLAKLGHSVLGIDISEEFISLAQKRLKNDPYPPFDDIPFNVEFMVHDIEESSLKGAVQYDVAILESCLHHFFNPISALRHVVQSIKEDGLVVIIEGSAPPRNSTQYQKNVEIMDQYHTLERPFTKKQMIQLLTLVGLHNHQFFFPLNGLFEQNIERVHDIKQIALDSFGWNIVFASRDSAALSRVCSFQAKEKFDYAEGFYGEEKDEQGHQFRWSRAHSILSLSKVGALQLEISSCYSQMLGKKQFIYIYVDNDLFEKYELTETESKVIIELNSLENSSMVTFFSDSSFSPHWFGLEDKRILSFMLRILNCK